VNIGYALPMRIKLPTLKCKRCQHRWIPSQPVITMCPKCKSRYWHTKRENRQGMRPEVAKGKKR
jgi:Zn finger protein HypA/HybF involved in hydrogenase expression